jgi:DNA-binding NarL/FixJ family response regulator
MKALRILLADDHEIVRQGLRRVLAERRDWTICGEAATGRQAVELARQLLPDLVIMDLTMPELNGLEATRQIRAALPQTEVLVLTMHASEELVPELRAAGARGFVLKSDAGRSLVAAVEALARHEPFFTARIWNQLGSADARSPQAGFQGIAQSRLTPREREIVQLIAEGKSTKELADQLGITIKTAETHRGNIMRKLGLRSVSEVVRYAIRNHLVEA